MQVAAILSRAAPARENYSPQLRITDSSSIDAVSFSLSDFQFAKLVQSIGEFKSPFPIPEKQSAFHPRTQRSAFRRRNERLQSRLPRQPKVAWQTRVPPISACQASIPLSAIRMWRANWLHAGQNYENGNPSPSRACCK